MDDPALRAYLNPQDANHRFSGRRQLQIVKASKPFQMLKTHWLTKATHGYARILGSRKDRPHQDDMEPLLSKAQ